MNRNQKLITYLGVSLFSSFVFALAWVIIMTMTLPETDMAHGQMPFENPLVFPVMSIFVGVSGIIAWPLYAWFGWHLQPTKVGMTAGAATLLFIAITTPFNAGVGWLGSYIALLSSLIICKFTMKQEGQQKDAHYRVPRKSATHEV